MDLTIILTTSPIKSNPSPALLTATISTFHYGGSDFSSCKKILVCDGYKNKLCDTGTPKSLMRVGIVNDEQQTNYEAFKVILSDLVLAQKDSPSLPFHNTELLFLPSRHGYGFAVKEALKHVTTKYVCVIQHDRTFLRKTPISEVVHSMDNNPSIKFVGMLMRSNLIYFEHFLGKYGKKWFDTLSNEMVVQPPELMLEKRLYSDVAVAKKLTDELISGSVGGRYMTLRDNYLNSPLYARFVGTAGTLFKPTPKQIAEAENPKMQASLIPTLFWYDNIHVVLTAHYRDFVFDPVNQLVAKGGFIEDKLSPALVKCCKKLGLIEGHAKFGCYLLDDHGGMSFTGHLDGGNFLTEDQRLIAVQKFMESAVISDEGAVALEESDDEDENASLFTVSNDNDNDNDNDEGNVQVEAA